MQASKLPPALDRAWEAVGGGPADLFFPEDFLGLWRVESVLTSVKLPLGPDFVPDAKVPDLAAAARLPAAPLRRPLPLHAHAACWDHSAACWDHSVLVSA